ncbi:MAG TPA: hypothetical protein EYG03_12615 [Planctomycetes bacterium]|nr:hypothetical protein [Fuerstiella sp.]HIK92806.1 hypothetical protein [Planctomycetota bacterium]
MRRTDTLRFLTTATTLLILTTAQCPITRAADEFDKPPISYRESTPDNCISRLQESLDSGTQTFTYESDQGYLKSLLNALNVPIESQMLVFSKTSLQLRRITPRTPRAIYFGDDIYVGYCQSGDVLEISAVDPQLGSVFYTLNQEQTETPGFDRRNDNCIVCHASSRTQGVPGHVVRSLYVDAGGQPMFSAGSRTVDHTTPIKERWGGWYVTGTHGNQSHVGNLIVRTKRVEEPVENSAGQNVLDLQDRFNVDRYISPHSDIVALMVMEHQTLVHNCLTKANFATRQALHYEKTMNGILDYGEDNRLDSTIRRIANAGDDLIEAILMVDEAPLTSPVKGTSGYADVFTRNGERDSQGRSLRDFDLTQRMFRYPCSYLIYSESFNKLPKPMHDYVWLQLGNILSGEDQSEKFNHLSESDRTAIAEILRDTKPTLPAHWATSPNVKVSLATP